MVTLLKGGNIMYIGFIVIAGIIFAAIAAFILIYNKFIQLRNLVHEAWSGIDVQLKRRHDLIPNLIETVKGYMQYERKLIEDVTNLRSEAIGAKTVAEKSAAEGALSRTLRSIFAVAEAYPDLKANQSYLDLQKNLSDLEAEIQLARRYYNGTVRNYNILTESFPSNQVAVWFNFKPETYFEIEDTAERIVPKVAL